MPRGALAVALFAVVMSIAAPSWAHEGHSAFLKVRVDDSSVTATIDLALADARKLLALPRHLPEQAAFDAIVSRQQMLAERVRSSFEFREAGRRCSSTVVAPAAERPEHSKLVRVHLSARCEQRIEKLSIHNITPLDVDPSYRIYSSVEHGSTVQAAVLGSERREVAFTLRHASAFSHFWPFLRQGAHHAATGFDHMLFLAALLLPAPMIRAAGRWTPRERALEVLLEIAFVSTAFMGAHSLTLCAAALDLVRLPARWVESTIALTVLIAALNNVGPLVRLRSWHLAFGLGLVHGFGFATQLGVLDLPAASRAVGLFAFNVGVEVGQFALVGACLPALLWLRRTSFYPRGVLEVPSLLIAWVAGVWLVERAFDVSLVG
jgi:hypothetical protein